MKQVISHISQWPLVTAMVMDEWKKKPEPFTIIKKRAPKTHEQLGYLHSTVLPYLAAALFNNGDIKENSQDAAKLWLKIYKNYGAWYQINGEDVFDAFSYEDADIDILKQAIDAAIDAAALRHVQIPEPKGKYHDRH